MKIPKVFDVSRRDVDRHKARKEVLVSYLQMTLGFCHDRGLESVRDLNSMWMKKAIEYSLWKLLELDGKYNQRFVSEGVYKALGWDRPDGTGLVCSAGEVISDRFELDHVITRDFLVRELVERRCRPADIGQHLLGCVVIPIEHERVRSNRIAADDPWERYRLAEPSVNVFDRVQCRFIDLNRGSADSQLRSLMN